MQLNFKHWLESAIDFETYDLQKKYDHYNTLLFNGELPKIPIKYAALKGVGGEVRIKIRGVPPDQRLVRMGVVDKYQGMVVVDGSHQMLISNIFKKSEQGLDAIMIHEMIHVYFNSIGKLGENHGTNFIRKARELGAKVGFQIPLTDNTEKMGLSNTTKTKSVGVQIVYRKDGSVRFAMMTDKVLQSTLPELIKRWQSIIHPAMLGNYGAKTEFYTVASAKWTELSYSYPAQRRKPMDMAYYTLKDPEALNDLKTNGKLLYKISMEDHDVQRMAPTQ